MKNNYTPMMKVLVVLSAGLTGYGIACLIHQFWAIGVINILCAIIIFAIAASIAYKKNESHIEYEEVPPKEKKKDDKSPEVTEESIDEGEFEDKVVKPTVVNPEVNIPTQVDNEDLESEFRG